MRVLLRCASITLLALGGCGLRLGSPDPTRRPAGPGRPCETAADCPSPREPCFEAACADGACRAEVVTAGTVPEAQAPGDCRELVCDGRGQAIPREDLEDTPADDGNDCTEERCDGDRAEHAPRPAGAHCGSGGVCNGAGICGVCVPGRQMCAGAVPKTCSAEGRWSEAAACGGAAPVCSKGGCAAPVDLALGEAATCVHLSDDGVRCFGSDRDGLLGGDRLPRVRVIAAGAGEIALGLRHGCARLRDGSVSCWGPGAYAPAHGVNGAVQIAAGDAHTCARLADGTVACWGLDHHGQLGDGGGKPDPRIHLDLPPPDSAIRARTFLAGPVAQIALGGDRTCVRVEDGAVDCWGPGAAAPITKPPAPSAARKVVGLKDAVFIAAGGSHTCAVTKDGAVSCWGDNARGQVDGGGGDRRAPVRVGRVKGAAALALGRSHTCALLSNGTVACWGDNTRGQLGDGTTKPRRGPIAVPGLSGVTGLGARGDHTCARLAGGGVRCWGDGAGGDLGDDGAAVQPAPVDVRW